MAVKKKRIKSAKATTLRYKWNDAGYDVDTLAFYKKGKTTYSIAGNIDINNGENDKPNPSKLAAEQNLYLFLVEEKEGIGKLLFYDRPEINKLMLNCENEIERLLDTVEFLQEDEFMIALLKLYEKTVLCLNEMKGCLKQYSHHDAYAHLTAALSHFKEIKTSQSVNLIDIPGAIERGFDSVDYAINKILPLLE